MNLTSEVEDLDEYLSYNKIVDWDNKAIHLLAVDLSKNVMNEVELAEKIYQYVRDKISHSFDINAEVVTCSASEVLQYKHGICYAKSHLLAALLRLSKFPTGFCYQKLVLDEKDKSQFVLHGLNAVYLPSLKRWFRVDARGNKAGIDAKFSLQKEVLAYSFREKLGEIDYPTIYKTPNDNVVYALKKAQTCQDLINHLPSEL